MIECMFYIQAIRLSGYVYRRTERLCYQSPPQIKNCWYSGAHCLPGGQAGQVELGARWQRQVELPPGGPLHARWTRQPGGPGGQVGSKSQVGHRPGGCQVVFAPGAPGGSPARWQYIYSCLLLTQSPTTKPCQKCFMPGGPPARWAPQRQVGYGNSIRV